MKVKIYDLIKDLLIENPDLRNSDRKLIWRVWEHLGHTTEGVNLTYFEFIKAPSTETIRRCRQKIQELNPELQATARVRKERKVIEDQKGTHVFRVKVNEQTSLL